ncbi:hypothetical protein DFH08DRAFT_1002761 [Mycena albidolilacea]|uniref:Uncharacterized protein n=1 Tax=Mycena albidolilacea TaxID=1033008 RepID=A0AAD7F2U9_9AGAR|nr:hypothetical protein DFH08DRAFT_1002761 [Mycena albidolilacea]
MRRLTWWFFGSTYSWGIMQAAFVKQGLSSSFTAACIYALALINARVIRFLGARGTALLGISLIGSGQILSFSQACVDISHPARFVVIKSAANGGFFSTIPTVVGNVFGSARLSVAMGMIVTRWAGGYLMGAPIGIPPQRIRRRRKYALSLPPCDVLRRIDGNGHYWPRITHANPDQHSILPKSIAKA